jgi:hypothetical protein
MGAIDTLELGMARVEGLENRENSMGDGGPGELVEGWAKAVGSRTGIIMHLLEGSMNFSWIKRPIKEIKGASWTRVESIQIKVPDWFARSTKEIREEAEEDLSLLIMTGDNTSIVLKQVDFITATTLGSSGMEKSCVLITIDGSPDLASLPPVEEFFFNCTSEDIGDNRTQGRLSRGKRATFLNSVKNFNNNLAVHLSLRTRSAMLAPILGSSSGAF